VFCHVMTISGKITHRVITRYVVHVVEIASGVIALQLLARDVKAMIIGICKDPFVF
jgi:hypothetical protein